MKWGSLLKEKRYAQGCRGSVFHLVYTFVNTAMRGAPISINAFYRPSRPRWGRYYFPYSWRGVRDCRYLVQHSRNSWHKDVQLHQEVWVHDQRGCREVRVNYRNVILRNGGKGEAFRCYYKQRRLFETSDLKIHLPAVYVGVVQFTDVTYIHTRRNEFSCSSFRNENSTPMRRNRRSDSQSRTNKFVDLENGIR